MKGRVTWRSRPHPEGGFGEARPGIRARYGDAVADIVEHCATLAAERRNWPTAQDVKKTLREIVARPEAADLQRLDAFTSARVADQALRRHRVQSIRSLTAEQLRDCAAAALDSFDWRNGRMPTDDVARDLVRELLPLAASLDRASQDDLIIEALLACGLSAGSRNIERLRELAKADRSPAI